MDIGTFWNLITEYFLLHNKNINTAACMYSKVNRNINVSPR